MHHARLEWSLLVMLALMFSVGAMQAARADDREAAKKACMDDYKKYCTGIFPGGGRVKKCLSDNLSRLEPACRDNVARNASDSKATKAK